MLFLLRKHHRRMILAAASLTTIVAGTFLLTGAAESNVDSSDYQLTFPSRGNFSQVKTVSGVVEPMTSTQVRSQSYWKTEILSIIPEGTWVQAGDVVCQLDSSAIEEFARTRETRVIRYRGLLDSAMHDQQMLKLTNQRKQSQTDFSQQVAQMNLDEYRDGTLPEQLRELEEQLETATLQANAAVEDFRQTEQLWSMGYVNRNRLDADYLSLMSHEQRCDQVEGRLNLLTRFTAPRKTSQLQLTSEDANRIVGRIRMMNSLAETRNQISILNYKRAVSIHEKYLDRARESIKACTLTAPCDGQVVYGNSWYLMSRGKTLIDEGKTVRRRQLIFEIPDRDQLKVSVPLEESYIYDVSVGMPVTVTLAGYDDVAIAGRVAQIPRYSRVRSSYARVREYWLDVELLPTAEQRPLLTPKADAAVEFRLRTEHDCLRIPRTAVTGVGGDNYVLRHRNGELLPTLVHLGAADDQYVVVKDGITENTQLATVITQQHQELLLDAIEQ